MKILFSHEINYETKVIYEVHEFPEMLALEGHEVTFLQFEEDADFRRGLKERVRFVNGRVYPECKIKLVTPHRFGLRNIDRIWTTLSSWITIWQLLRKNEFDIVVNYAVPTFGVQLMVLSKLFRVPFIHRALDASHVIIRSKWKWPIYLTEKIIYRFAENLSTNNPAMSRYCGSVAGTSTQGLVHYPPLDLSHFKNRQHRDVIASSLGMQPDERVIVYMGTLFYFSGLDSVIKSFDEADLKSLGYKLLIIGFGEQDEYLKKLVTTLGLGSNVIFTGIVDYADLPSYMAIGDVAINPMEKHLVSDVAFPHKVIQYLATGLPVVSTRLEGLFGVFGAESSIQWADGPNQVIPRVMETMALLNKEPRNVKLFSEDLSRFASTNSLARFREFLISVAGNNFSKR